ncbi:isopentenyl phosphate kinase [Haloarcula onubensis]|uniref:Isopentenyl phosphate kinase n=1 Tax=Haloarcula onubensis TaxID=2950539 RepID=A0ABU2FQU6_9EURY|nr:isopentenyl phosphate kinase [Halomicroarcula sp. S3CR25-11]MDS0283135.1 isopentenyl phosphate kinase [Halomicroarcula sp. S3CR25-11]
MTVVLKLGGSVVTEKGVPETVDDEALAAAADAVADYHGELVVVHGGGSFGHHHAADYGVSTTEGTHDAAGVAAIHGAMKRLNDAVVAALAERGVPAVPVHPFSAASRGADGRLDLPTAQVRTMLAEGFVPVLHGDLVAHRGEGATVLSGDELVVELAPAVDADRVGVCSTVPGVLDETGAVIDSVSAFDEVASALGGSDATDVSGGMAGKVRALLALDSPAHVFGPDALSAFLAGGDPGTTVAGDDAR